MPDPLDAPATISVLRRLRAKGAVPREAHALGLRLLDTPPTAVAWARFAEGLLLFLGAALVLAGIIYFFAFNWDALGRFVQMGGIAGLIAACALGAFSRFDRPSGQALVLSAAVLVGPLLGVVGTTYQTGADPYELFVAWTLLALPWAAIARLPSLWLVVLTLANVSVSLYWVQVLAPESTYMQVGGVHALTVLNGGAWLVWEGMRARPWMATRWLPRLLLFVALAPAVVTGGIWIFEPRELAFAPGLALVGVLLAAAWWAGRVRLLDRGLLAVAATALLVVTSTVLGRFVSEVLDAVDSELLIILGFGVSGFFVAAKVALAARWIVKVAPLGDAKEAA